MTSAGGKGSDDAVAIDALLGEFGYDTPTARARARDVLQAAGLTRAGKQGIAATKRGRVEQALRSALVRVCGKRCAALARESGAREPVIVGGAACEVCGGSNNRRAALECARALRKNRISRLLVIGGSTTLHHELASLFPSGDITIECVDGTQRSHSQRDALQRMNRAQLMVIWGSTELRHAISNLYTDETPPHLRRITVARRSIGALCDAIVLSYAQKPA